MQEVASASQQIAVAVENAVENVIEKLLSKQR